MRPSVSLSCAGFFKERIIDQLHKTSQMSVKLKFNFRFFGIGMGLCPLWWAGQGIFFKGWKISTVEKDSTSDTWMSKCNVSWFMGKFYQKLHINNIFGTLHMHWPVCGDHVPLRCFYRLFFSKNITKTRILRPEPEMLIIDHVLWIWDAIWHLLEKRKETKHEDGLSQNHPHTKVHQNVCFLRLPLNVLTKAKCLPFFNPSIMLTIPFKWTSCVISPLSMSTVGILSPPRRQEPSPPPGIDQAHKLGQTATL